MVHLHEVRDMDTHYVIDPITMAITNANEAKNKLMLGDHDSEIYTFEIPRVVEGHDMTLCNLVEVHFINVSASKTEKSEGVFKVSDMAAAEDSADTLAFSWKVSGKATKYAGSLNYRIKFACTDENGNYTYKKWTDVYKGITVSDGFDNGEVVAEENTDIIAQWEARLDALEQGNDGVENAILYTEQTLTDEQKAQARSNIGAAKSGVGYLKVDGNTGALRTVGNLVDLPDVVEYMGLCLCAITDGQISLTPSSVSNKNARIYYKIVAKTGHTITLKPSSLWVKDTFSYEPIYCSDDTTILSYNGFKTVESEEVNIPIGANNATVVYLGIRYQESDVVSPNKWGVAETDIENAFTVTIDDYDSFLLTLGADGLIYAKHHKHDTSDVRVLTRDDFEQGTVSVTTSGNKDSTTRIRSKGRFEVKAGDVVSVSGLEGFSWICSVFADVQYSSILDNSDWLKGNNKYSYTIKADGILALQICNNAGTTDIIPEDLPSTAKIFLPGTVMERVESLEKRVFSLEGGLSQYSYIGEKMPSRVNYFESETAFQHDDISGTGQDMDIYGDYLFTSYSSPEKISVRSLVDNSLVAELAVETNHGSGIQFSNEFYDSADTFPLLYVGGGKPGIIQVMRITNTDGVWSVEIVRTLFIPISYGYYLAPSLDAKSNILYTYGYKNEEWFNNTGDNAMRLARWDLAHLTENEDGTYTPLFISECTTPYLGVTQGRIYYGGNLYVGFSDPVPSDAYPLNSRILTIDAVTGEVKANVDLVPMLTRHVKAHAEIEGVCYRIVGKKIYWYIDANNKVMKLTF